MFPIRRFISVFLLGIGALLFCKNSDAQEPLWGGYRTEMPLPVMWSNTENLTDGSKQFFLLKTGMLVEASVETAGDSIKLKTQYGTMQVPKENIEFACETRENVYRYKKSQVSPNSCTQIINLAEWCLDNGFNREAFAEFQAALLIAPNDNLKNFIQQRIEQIQRSATQTEIAAKTINEAADGETRDTTDFFDRWANGVPNHVFDTFSKKVQPILVQRCASADCHGTSSSQKFKIQIPRQPGGKTTRNNFRATVQFINPDNPGASQVLSALVTKHAGKRALFSVESEQYANFIDWFQRTARELPPEWQNEMFAQNGVNQNAVKQVVYDVKPDTGKPETVKLDTLPKQFQESLEAMTKTGDAMPKTGLKLSTPPNVPHIGAAENMAVQQFSQAAKQPENSENPFDPFRFNSKYHGKIIEAKLKKQVSDTVIR